MTGAYYSENDSKAAAWLRELIRQGHIAPGDVDERSIEDVLPRELAGYTQCHFFAGIGGWSYALRLAGWPDDRSIWTGSCPCQPFSAAGKGKGFADERHLWPAWFHLVRECRPSQVFGEQVANALSWFDLVSTDLEAEGYAVGACIVGAHSVGAPHIRQRLYWVADLSGDRREQRRLESNGRRIVGCSELGNASGARSGRHPGALPREEGSAERGLRSELDESEPSGPADIVGHAGGERLEGRSVSGGGRANECTAWTPSDPVWCRDGKWRPVEPGTFPLAHGVPERVGLLRGYGNAIVPQVAAAFIEATGLA